MPVDQSQLTTDLDFIRSQPAWQSGDETQRRDYARKVAVESAAAQDPEQHQALVSKLWEEADPRGWVGKSADFVGTAVKEVAASAVAAGPAFVMAGSDAVGMTDTGSGVRLRRGVADLGNAVIQTVKQFAPNDAQEQMGGALDALREDIHNGAVPDTVKRWLTGDEQAAQDPEAKRWVDSLTTGLGRMAAKADTRLQLNPGLRKDAVAVKSEDELMQSWLKSDRNPANVGVQDDGTQMSARDHLADYLVTRDPASWQQFVNRVTETESQHKTRVGRSLTGENRAQNIASQMGVQGDLLTRGMDMQTSPIDMATAALPLLRGTKLLKATMEGAEAGSVARRVAMGAGEEALQEGITQKLQDARASNADVIEAAAMGAIGSGAVEGTMAGTGALLTSSGRGSAAGPASAPGATAPGGTTGPDSTPPGAGGRAGSTSTGGQSSGAPNAASGTGPASSTSTAPGGQTGANGSSTGGQGTQSSGNAAPTAPQWQPDSVRRMHGQPTPQTLPAPGETSAQMPYRGVDVEGVGARFDPTNKRTRPVIPDSPLGGLDILDFVNENPIALPRKGTAEGGDMDWQERYSLPKYYRQFLGHESGRGIDQVAQSAYDANLIPEPSPDALMSAVESAIQTRKQYRFEQRSQKARMLDEEKRVMRFERAQAKLQGKADVVPFDAMQVGDELTVAGEVMKVKHLTYDQDGYPQSITMEDGKKFGLLSFDANLQNGVLVDEFRPVPRADVSTDFMGADELSRSTATTTPARAMPAPPASQGPAVKPGQVQTESDLRGIQGGALDSSVATSQDFASVNEGSTTEAQRGSRPLEVANDAGSTPATGVNEELSRKAATASAFERASLGDDAAFEDLDAVLRARYGRGQPVSSAEELSRQVFTQAGFEQVFEEAFARKDFDTILDAMKQSDRAVYAPLLKRFFAEQADNPQSAMKADWMRHVFNGTRPADAMAAAPQSASAPPPRQQTPPTSTASSTPPPRAASTGSTTSSTPPPRATKSGGKPPPAQTPPRAPRIPVNPIRGRLAKSPYQIINDYGKAIGKLFQVRKLKPSQLGVYRPGSTMTANRFAGDLDTAAHELAGHWTDDKHGLGKPWMNQATSPYDAELASFWIHGSPSTNPKIQRAEGIAEWLRAYVMDPQAAIAAAPRFAAYVQRTLPADAMKALNDFSDDVRTWAGENPLRRSSLNIRMERPSVKERLRTALYGDGSAFGKTWADKMKGWFSDEFHYAVKGFETALKLQGRTLKSLRPSENFELLLRWLSGHDSRFSEQLENGLTPLATTQAPNANGELEVQRVTDPVTGQPMNLAWLLEAFDNSNEAAQKQDMKEASALMVAERTLERAKQIDDEATAKLAALPANGSAKTRASIIAAAEQAKKRISGLGAGMMSDPQAARETIAALDADPNKARRLREAARRYRAWANANLELLVESGRMTREEVDRIKKANTQYVDMHRLSEDFDLAAMIQGGRGKLHPGTAKDLLKRFKGSTLEIDNVYASLLKQTEAIQHEAMRNRVMQTFVQQLESARGLYEGDPVELDKIGSRATAEDRNTIRVFRKGVAEYWKLDADIHTALKGVGDLGSHQLVDLIGKMTSVIRWVITRSPAFMIRNPIRDAIQRPVVSNTDSKPWDILHGYTDADKSRLMAFGGGMFGHYGKDRFAWHKELERGMGELRKDPRNMLHAPMALGRALDKLGESSEALGRVAEFRRAFDKGKRELGYTDDEAALYAANEARGLLDFAKMGSWMRVINKIIPFSNAAVRGLARSASGLKADPLGFSARWMLYVAMPTLAVRMLAKQMGGDVEDEYQQLPAWQRDFFWNVKLGRYWLRIPKPHELGVMAGGVERALSRELGEKNSFDGYGGSVSTAMIPVNDIPSLLGPLKAPAEIVFNRDTFRDRDIIPIWEKDLKLELRKGTKNASMAGQAVGNLIGMDPRNIDHLFGSFGGLGQSLIDFTKPEKKLGESLIKATGVALPTISSQSKDYQWVMDWAKSNGKLTDKHVKALRELTQQVYRAESPEEADKLAKALRQQATAIRGQVMGRAP